MYVIRETMHCKPGKVRPLVEKFKKMGEIMVEMGMSKPRLMTDISGPQYWTLVTEFEVSNLSAFLEMDDKAFEEAGAAEIMKGYHELVDHGRREIFKLES